MSILSKNNKSCLIDYYETKAGSFIITKTTYVYEHYVVGNITTTKPKKTKLKGYKEVYSFSKPIISKDTHETIGWTKETCYAED